LTWRRERVIRGAPARHRRQALAETNLPAVQSEAESDPRLSPPKFYSGGQGGSKAAPRQGAKAPGGVSTPKVKWSERFPESLRLKKRAEFLHVQEHGVKITGEVLVALAVKSSKSVTRIGLTVSRRVGNAVERNRMRRRLREVFRKNRDQLPVGLDLVLIGRSNLRNLDLKSLTTAFLKMSEKLRQVFP